MRKYHKYQLIDTGFHHPRCKTKLSGYLMHVFYWAVMSQIDPLGSLTLTALNV